MICDECHARFNPGEVRVVGLNWRSHKECYEAARMLSSYLDNKGIGIASLVAEGNDYPTFQIYKLLHSFPLVIKRLRG